MTIEIVSEVHEQADEARTYYDTVSESLGTDFLKEMNASLRLIQKLPFQPYVNNSNVRSRMMRRFPYRFFYVVDEARQHIQVLAVLHAARDPGLWPGA